MAIDAVALMEEKRKKLNEIRESIKNYASDEQLQKRFEQHRYTARQRIDKLFDPGTFMELDMHVKHHCTFFGMDKKEIPADGVITGFGQVNNRLVFAYSQDFMALGGSFGEMHGNKILKGMQRALEAKVPVIGFCESGGLRLHEAQGAMGKYGELFKLNTVCSGVIPQISVITGIVAGGQAYSPGLTDFIFMDKASSMFIAGPAFVKAQLGYDISEADLGGAKMHATVSGVVDFLANNEDEVIQNIKELLSYIPSSNKEKPPLAEYIDQDYKYDLEWFAPAANPKKPFDMKKIIKAIIDNGKFFELKQNFAKNMLTGFTRIGGHSVGLVANQSTVFAGCIDTKAAEKAARFVRFCDAFNIPVVTLVDSPAYLIGKEQEQKAIILKGAKLLHAYSEATVPLITIMLRNAYAGAQLAMGSKYLGADYVYAWPSAEVATVAAKTAASVVFGKEIKQAVDPKKVLEERSAYYTDTFCNAYYAASGQHIDDVIDPIETRNVIINSIKALANKELVRPWKKHGNIPL